MSLSNWSIDFSGVCMRQSVSCKATFHSRDSDFLRQSSVICNAFFSVSPASRARENLTFFQYPQSVIRAFRILKTSFRSCVTRPLHQNSPYRSPNLFPNLGFVLNNPDRSSLPIAKPYPNYGGRRAREQYSLISQKLLLSSLGHSSQVAI